MVEAINGKVAGLRRMQNEMITIVSLQHRLGDDRPVVGAGYRESTEGQILAVDAHNVRLLLTSGLNVTEALGRVEISRDDAKHRSKIIVRG
jgi:hypothetical protein